MAPTWLYLVVWISLSMSLILMNKAILSTWGFPYPFFLTAWHMMFATVLTQILSRTTNILPGVKANVVSLKVYQQKIVPIAFCFATSLVCGNKAYVFLSVAFIQMLKAFTPVSVQLLSFVAGLESPSVVQMLIVCFISVGVTMSAVGEIKFSWVGFALQGAGIGAESFRLVLADQFLKDLKLDALSTLYYIAPPSFIFIALGFVVFEADDFPYERLSGNFAGILLFNGLAAFALNIASVLLISTTSAMTLTLGGLIKDVLLVVSSVVFFSSPIATVQIVGYSISLYGMNVYKDFKKSPETVTARVHSLLRIVSCGLLCRSGGSGGGDDGGDGDGDDADDAVLLKLDAAEKNTTS